MTLIEAKKSNNGEQSLTERKLAPKDKLSDTNNSSKSFNSNKLKNEIGNIVGDGEEGFAFQL